MIVDVFELTPNNPKPRKDCYFCLGCSHLKRVTVDSSHDAYIECDLDEEEDKQ